MNLAPTTDAARGKWRGVLIALGIPEVFLQNKHGPCPLCGGKDRFRWDNKEGRGTFICNGCGAGDGMTLAIKFTGLPFGDVAARIDGILGNVKTEPPRPGISDEQRRAALRAVYLQTKNLEPGDLADRYLATRGLNLDEYPPTLRFAKSLRDGAGGIHPAMVALVGVAGQSKPCSMHRTFLRRDGKGKAEIPAPRKLMPGSLPDGACVALSEYVPGGPLGIAEGIETALAAARYFEVPVWAALNTALLRRWRPPAGCTDVTIFGDNDANHAGANAAYDLARRLAQGGIEAHVQIPPHTGSDWADVWDEYCQGAFGSPD